MNIEAIKELNRRSFYLMPETSRVLIRNLPSRSWDHGKKETIGKLAKGENRQGQK